MTLAETIPQTKEAAMSEPARKDIARVEERATAATAPTSMMEVIARAVSDPNLDVDKLERLTGLYERLTDREAEMAFNDAMNAAQAELSPVATDLNNSQTHSKYASYPALDRAVRPIYSRHGFSLSFGTGDGAGPDCLRVTCRVSHRAGHSRDYHVDMPADGKGAKGGDVMTKTHAVGAAMSYGQRYLLKLIFNIAVGEDTDGNAPKATARAMGAIARKAIEEINGCDTVADLAAWKRSKADGLAKVVEPAELTEIIRTCTQRLEAMKAGSADHDA